MELEDVSELTSITPAFRVASGDVLTSLLVRVRVVELLLSESHNGYGIKEESNCQTFHQYLVKRKAHGKARPHFTFKPKRQFC